MKKFLYLFAILVSFLLVSCSKKDSVESTSEDSPTPEELKGMIKTCTFPDFSNSPIQCTYYYNSKKNIKRIDILRYGKKSQEIYKYINFYILRYFANSLGSNMRFSDSLILNQNGLVKQWNQYSSDVSGNYYIQQFFFYI